MKITMLIATLLLSFQAFAGFGAFSNTTNLGIFSYIKCSTGLTCTKVGNQMQVVASQTSGTSLTLSGTLTATGGMVASAGQRKNYPNWQPGTFTSGTSVQGVATTGFVTQLYLDNNAALTGLKINNGATVGTNKYIVALYNSAGALVANSATAGLTTAGASVYQAVPFTATYNAVGPAVYYAVLTINGTTDNFIAIPAVGESSGYASTITGQTFGTVASTITVPTTFTAGVGPILFTY